MAAFGEHKGNRILFYDLPTGEEVFSQVGARGQRLGEKMRKSPKGPIPPPVVQYGISKLGPCEACLNMNNIIVLINYKALL